MYEFIRVWRTYVGICPPKNKTHKITSLAPIQLYSMLTCAKKVLKKVQKQVASS